MFPYTTLCARDESNKQMMQQAMISQLQKKGTRWNSMYLKKYTLEKVSFGKSTIQKMHALEKYAVEEIKLCKKYVL